jgi:hypothetical protein
MTISAKHQRLAAKAILSAQPGVVTKISSKGQRPSIFGLKMVIHRELTMAHVGGIGAAVQTALSTAAADNTSLELLLVDAQHLTLEHFTPRALVGPSTVLLCAVGAGARKALNRIAAFEECWGEFEKGLDCDGFVAPLNNNGSEAIQGGRKESSNGVHVEVRINVPNPSDHSYPSQSPNLRHRSAPKRGKKTRPTSSIWKWLPAVIVALARRNWFNSF